MSRGCQQQTSHHTVIENIHLISHQTEHHAVVVPPVDICINQDLWRPTDHHVYFDTQYLQPLYITAPDLPGHVNPV